MNKILLAILLVFAVFLGSIGQLLFKIGLSPFSFFIILLGIIFYAVSTIMYFYALAESELGWAYSFIGLSYIFVAILAYLFLNETLDLYQIISIIVIVIGVYLVGGS